MARLAWAIRIVLVAALITSPLSAQAIPDPDPGNQPDLEIFALGASLSYRLDEHTGISSLAAHLSDVDAGYYQVGANHRWGENLSLGGDFIAIAPDGGDTQSTVRGHFTLEERTPRFRFDLRTAVEYRIQHESVSERVRSRARMRSTYTGLYATHDVTGYVSVEPNYDHTESRWQQTNYAVGFSYQLTDRVALEPSYIRVDSYVGPDIDLVTLLLTIQL